MHRFCTIISIVALYLTTGSAHAETPLPEWESIANESSIEVFQRKVPGSSFVSFKGVGIVDASIYDVYSVIFDIRNKTKLLSNCGDYQLLKFKSMGNLVVYTRTQAPFVLISDRDTVLETKVDFQPNSKTIYARFKKGDDTLMPPPDDAVRTKELQGGWTLEVLSPTSTKVTYEVNANPGGLLPAWLVNLGSRKLPLKTLMNLRSQVTHLDAHQRARLIVKYHYDFQGFLPSDHPVFEKSVDEEASAKRAFEAYQADAKYP